MYLPIILARNAAHDSVRRSQKQKGLMKSSIVTAVKEFTADDMVLSEALKTPAMQSPDIPGMLANILSIANGSN